MWVWQASVMLDLRHPETSYIEVSEWAGETERRQVYSTLIEPEAHRQTCRTCWTRCSVLRGGWIMAYRFENWFITKNDLLVQVRRHYSLPLRMTITSHRPSNITSLSQAQLIPKMWSTMLIKKKELQWNHFWNVRRVWVRNTPRPMLLLSLGWSPSNLAQLHIQLCR